MPNYYYNQNQSCIIHLLIFVLRKFGYHDHRKDLLRNLNLWNILLSFACLNKLHLSYRDHYDTQNGTHTRTLGASLVVSCKGHRCIYLVVRDTICHQGTFWGVLAFDHLDQPYSNIPCLRAYFQVSIRKVGIVGPFISIKETHPIHRTLHLPKLSWFWAFFLIV